MNYLQIFEDKAELIEQLSMEARGELLTACMQLAFSGELVSREFFKTEARYVWPVFRKMVNDSIESYLKNMHNGSKGGRPKKPTENPTETQPKPNNNPTETQPKPTETINQDIRYKKQDIYIKQSCSCSCSIPSAGEVEAYAASKGEAPVDISGFMAYNATLNWKCLPNWQSAYDLWVKRDKERQQQQQGRKVLKDQDYHQRDVAESCEIPEWQRQAMAEWLQKEGALTNGQNATAQAPSSG